MLIWGKIGPASGLVELMEAAGAQRSSQRVLDWSGRRGISAGLAKLKELEREHKPTRDLKT